jgi:Predicted permease, DMT superfamily
MDLNATSRAAPARSWRALLVGQGSGMAIGQVVLGVIALSGSDAFAKLLGAGLPAAEVTWLRYVVFTAAIVAVAAMRPGASWRSRRPRLQVVRGLLVLGSAQLFVLGLGHLGVAEATAVAFVAPVLITLLSIPLLGEVVGRRRWTALAVGLIGVLIVVRPGAEAFGPGALLPLASAFLGALSVIAARKLGAVDAPTTTLLWSACVGLGGLTLAAPFWFEPLGARALLLGLAMGGLYALGQAALISAYSVAPASLLAPFTYAQLLSAALIGALAFDRYPDAVSLVGMGVIALSGAYTLLRERHRTRGPSDIARTAA